MSRFNILHLTDIHFGQKFLGSRWKNVEEAFWEDLAYVVNEVGPINLIAFTGDIAFSGSREQFERGTDFLTSLRQRLQEKSRIYPLLVIVPGNHDLMRPDPNNPTLLVLTELGRIELLNRAYSAEDGSTYKNLIDAAFESFTIWIDSRSLDHLPVDKGILPGDFVTKIENDDLLIGLVGLNATFLQLRNGDFDGRLVLLPKQIDKVSQLASEQRFEQNHVNLLLTHQAIGWLSEKSKNDLEEILFPDRHRISAHLFGHMHGANFTGESKGGGKVRYFVQGKSLCGLETWGENSPQQRFHGYGIISIERNDRSLTLALTPRSAIRQVGRGWVFDRDLSGDYALPRGSDSTAPFLLADIRQLAQEITSGPLPASDGAFDIKAPQTQIKDFPKTEEAASSILDQISMQANELREEPLALRWERRWGAADALSNSLVCIKRLLSPEIEPTPAETAIIHTLIYLADLSIHRAFVGYSSLAELSEDTSRQVEYLSIISEHERLVRRAEALRTLTNNNELALDIESWLVHNALLHSDTLWTGREVYNIARVFAAVLESRPTHVENLATDLVRLAREVVTLRSTEKRFGGGDSLLPQGLALETPSLPEYVRRSVTVTVAKTAWHMTLSPIRGGKEIVEQIGAIEQFSPETVLADLADTSWHITNDDLPVFFCACSDPAVEVSAYAHIDHLKTVFAREMGNSETENLIKSRIISRLAIHGIGPRADLGGNPVYEKPISRVSMSGERIRELLMGKQLYGDARLAIRELYQNSLDACRYRQLREKYLMLKRDRELERIAWQGRIEFSLKQVEGDTLVLECRDNGVGMERKQINGAFLRAGERFIESPDFAHEQAKWLDVDQSLKLTPNSTFGIGVFSYFMLADKIDVYTRRQNSDGTLSETLHVVISAGSSIARIYRTNEILLPDGGTIVQLTLRPEFDDQSRVGLRRTLLDLVQYCPFKMHVEDLYEEADWKAEQISEEVGGHSEIAFSKGETHAWWIARKGNVLADGIKTPEETFGFVASLHGDQKPTLRTDRNQVLAWDEAWVLDQLAESSSTLAKWSGLSISWLWRFAERYPTEANQLVERLKAVSPMIPLGQSELWEQEVDLRIIGCFPADRYLVKPLWDNMRFPTEYPHLPLPPDKKTKHSYRDNPHVEFPSGMTLWRRAVWLAALPGLLQGEERRVTKLTGERDRPVLSPTSIDRLWVPDPIDAAIIASQPHSISMRWNEELGWTTRVDLVALIHGAHLARMPLGEANIRLMKLSQFGLRAVPVVNQELENYIPSQRDLAIMASLGPVLSGITEIHNSQLLELLPLSRHESVGLGELSEQACWLLHGLGIKVPSLGDFSDQLRHHVPNEREVRFFGFDPYESFKLRDGEAPRIVVQKAINRASLRFRKDIEELVAKYDWFDLGGIFARLEELSFDEEDELSLQAWSSNFDKRPPWIDRDVFRRGYFSPSAPDQRELLGHSIFWSILSGETLRAAVKRIWTFPGLRIEFPDLESIPDEVADETDLKLLRKRFGRVSRVSDSRLDGIGLDQLMLREIMPIELLEAKKETKLRMKTIFKRLSKFRFAGVVLPECDPGVLGRARLSKIRRRLMFSKDPDQKYDRFGFDRDKAVPILGPITRRLLFSFANERHLTLAKAFDVLESLESLGMKHDCKGIDPVLSRLEPSGLEVSMANRIQLGNIGLQIGLASHISDTTIAEIIELLEVWILWILQNDNITLLTELKKVKAALQDCTLTFDDCVLLAAARIVGRRGGESLQMKHLVAFAAEANISIRELKQRIQRLAPLLVLDGVDIRLVFEYSSQDMLAPGWLDPIITGTSIGCGFSYERLRNLLLVQIDKNELMNRFIALSEIQEPDSLSGNHPTSQF